VYHFTPPTLTRVLNDAGFDVVHSTTFAIEHDVFGWLQSALNRVCSRPNVLFEWLTQKEHQRPPYPKRDVALSLALSPLMATWILPMTLLSWPMGRGCVLTMTCRPKR
jgi:hypothetical protein